ncbi:histone-lysine N-methyltransferase SETMAR-like [Contarinia nasturtii]|uniref:histone-lysine N-methyltransferase SETMAR-like n=1 Tax=Contarinia nasturtii TaxID=265458 RepID=UPI0012D39FFD|nr:histone-lysine N-methyltransferase SETMAR-like [Contarinia nasturtii]
MEKDEFRVLIKHYFLRKKTITETKNALDKHYPDSAPATATIHKWFTEFKCGRTSTSTVPSPGRPKEVVIDETVKKLHNLVLGDPKLKVREIAETTGISHGSVFKILHEHLKLKKLFAHWVPQTLNLDQKEERANIAQQNLKRFKLNPKEFLTRFITVDEMWIHYFDSEEKLNQLHFEVLPHPNNAPDLAPSNYHLLPNLKKWFSGKKFYSKDELITETNAYFDRFVSEYYEEGINMLESRWTKCIESEGDYVDD